MGDKVILLILYIVSGALLTALSVPLLLEKIRPNGLYGFRVAKTMNNPEIWYAVNKYSARRLFWAGASMLPSIVKEG